MVKKPEHRDLFPGALELMILQTLHRKPMHGYALAQHIKAISDDLLQIEEGSLYPALQRMLKTGWLESEMGLSARESSGAHLQGDGRRPETPGGRIDRASRRCLQESTAFLPSPSLRSSLMRWLEATVYLAVVAITNSLSRYASTSKRRLPT